MTPIIEAHKVTKSFGDVRALDGLDLVAESGHVTSLLGPNGAGKTTFISAVATLLRPDGGEVRVAGVDVCAQPKLVRRVIGLAGQYASVEPAMTGTENLRMVARLFGLDRREARTAAAEVLERLGLADAGDRLVRTYSGGMRRRLDLGASLVGRPQLLLLDEPTTGLDPRGRMDLWDAIRGLVADGTDVLLTTQYLEEADQLARHIVIVDHGRAIAAGTPGRVPVVTSPPSKRHCPGSAVKRRTRTWTPSASPRASRVARISCATSCGFSTSATSRSTTSGCAVPASTRSSWPSPGSASSRAKRRPMASPTRLTPPDHWSCHDDCHDLDD
jgi:ABC-type multidrug transport system ATPase subunit